MKRYLTTTKLGFLCSLFLSFSLFSNAQVTIQSVSGGNWNNTSTWDKGRVPDASDNVLIQHDVQLASGPVTVKNLEVNDGAIVDAQLRINNSQKLIVTENFIVHSTGRGMDVVVDLGNSATLDVDGSMTFTRDATNGNILVPTTSRTGIDAGNSSETIIGGNLVFNYLELGSEENDHEMDLKNMSKFTINGNFVIYAQGGKEFELHVRNNSKLTCMGELEVNTTEAELTEFKVDVSALFEVHENARINNNSNGNNPIVFYISGIWDCKKSLSLNSIMDNSEINLNIDGSSSELWIGGDLELDGGSEQDIMINMIDNAKLYILGNMNRVAGYGFLNMSSNSTWVYKGTTDQIIASTSGNGLDKLNFTNIVFDNEGAEMTLEGDLVIDKELTFTKGIMKTTPTALLIIEDGGSITGAGPDSYVDGPMKRLSLTDFSDFEFPLGNEGVYAPFSIETTGGRATGGEYTAQYYNCPPPWETNIAVGSGGVEQISSQEHWTFEQTETSAEVNVVLHWTDAAAQGITNTDSLVVVMYNDPDDPHPNFAKGWTSIGNGGVVCESAGCASGSITNIGTCPPPWEISQFTFGSTDASNALPVNMETFVAKKAGVNVDINWRTSSENKASHFEIQKSIDGVNFEEIDRVNAKGINGEMINYNTVDKNPAEGINYYRIRQVDNDGMGAMTNVVSVRFDMDINLIAYPNPIQNEFVLKGDFLKNAESLRVVDNLGRLIYQSEITAESEFLNLDAQGLNIDLPGIYTIEIESNSVTNTIRLMKG